MIAEALILGKSIATKIGAAVVTQLAKLLRPRLSSMFSAIQIERLYLRRVARQVERMPVIYRGIEMNPRTDYAEASLTRLANAEDSLRLSRPSSEVNRLKDYQINRVRRIVWLGEAGIGKTTLLRKVVLEIATRRFSEDSLIKEPGLVPVYVPLKAVSVLHAAPVLNYILNSIDYFRGSLGRRRFLRLALRRRLAIFLDGYDEIPYLDKERLIERELGVLLSSNYFIDTRLSPSREYGKIHRALQQCRIWVTSRKEFFFANQFALSQASCFEVQGLPSNGYELIRSILAYYKRNIAREGGEPLDEARFLDFLNTGIAEGLGDLSNNPLFLTILAYSTFQAMRAGGDVSAVWRDGQRGVIGACVNQLLLEMDKEKFESLSVIDRTRLTSNRARWSEQKFAIVRRIAWCGYERGIAMYRRSDIKAVTIEFLDEAKFLPDRDTIAGGLESEDFSVNIVAQVCYSGVLVGVRNSERELVYDFIHRRFRESLAAQCVLEDVGIEKLCESVHVPSMSELVLVVAREEGRWYQLSIAVMDAIFSLDKDRQPYWHVSVLLAGLFQLPTDPVDKPSLFGQMVERCLSRNVYPLLELRQLDFLSKGNGAAKFRGSTLDAIVVAAEQRDAPKVGFCLPILHAIDPSLYERRLEELLDVCDTTDDFARTVMTFAARRPALYRAAVERLLGRAFARELSRNDPVLLAAINTFLRKAKDQTTQWEFEGIISRLETGGLAHVELVNSIGLFEQQVNSLPDGGVEAIGTARNRLMASRFAEASNWRDATVN